MQTFSVGDLATSLILNRQNANIKSAMQGLATETTTGLTSDETARLKGNYVPIAGIESSLSQLEAYRSVTSETQILTGAMQVALGTISDLSSTLEPAMLAGATSNSGYVIDALGAESAQKLASAMAALNTRVADRSVFSGVKSDQTAVSSSDDLLASLQGAIAASGAVTAGEVETAVNGWFDDPNGFAAQIYKGGDMLAPVAIGPGQTAQVDVTVKDPAIISTLKGLALGVLLSKGLFQGDLVSRADVVKRAGVRLAASQTELAQLGARLGATEAAIQNAAARNDAEKGALETGRLNLLSVDPYETASKFQETQGQLQTLYALTARVSQLKLVDFL